MDEYEQIQRLRELWSRAIMTWGQVFLPLGAAIVAFFVTQSRTDASGWDFQLLFIGWLLFSACMGYWRWVVHHIDEQIVGMYPSMLRLDKDRKWEMQTRYYYGHLHKRSLRLLSQELKLGDEARRYEDFKSIAQSHGKDHYELLLKVWGTYDRYSVTSRGHAPQDAIVLGVVVSLLVPVLWIEFQAWSLAALLLYLVVIFPWGRHRGWWCIND